jgi:hypothetical protein
MGRRRAERPRRGTRAPLVCRAVADPGRRSRAWGVLAVSLALMALVTALSSTTGHRPDGSAAVLERSTSGTDPGVHAPSRDGGPRARATTVDAATRIPYGARAGTGGLDDRHDVDAQVVGTPVRGGSSEPGSGGRLDTGVPGVAASEVFATSVTSGGDGGSGAAPPSSGDAASASRGTQGGATLPVGGAPRPTTAPSSTPSANGLGGSAGGGTGTHPGRGSIDAPATTVSFPAAGGGPVAAQATWTGTVTLELEISCPGGVSVTRTGTSGLSVEVDDSRGTGECTVTLAVPPGARADVSYTLVIDPAS